MYHLKEVPHPVPGNLDLNIADDEEFSPDKLRSNLERLYMTVIIGLLAFVKHIGRLRSWRETRRTAWFCTVSCLSCYISCAIPNPTAGLLCRVGVRLHRTTSVGYYRSTDRLPSLPRHPLPSRARRSGRCQIRGRPEAQSRRIGEPRLCDRRAGEP